MSFLGQEGGPQQVVFSPSLSFLRFVFHIVPRIASCTEWEEGGKVLLIHLPYVHSVRKHVFLVICFPSVDQFIGFLKRRCQTTMPTELFQFSPRLERTAGYHVLQLVGDPGGGRASKCDQQ